MAGSIFHIGFPDCALTEKPTSRATPLRGGRPFLDNVFERADDTADADRLFLDATAG